MKTAKENHACTLCRRRFQGQEEPGFVSRVMYLISAVLHIAYLRDQVEARIEKTMQRASEEFIKALEADLEAFQSVRSSYDSYLRLTQTEIPAIEQELLDLKREQYRLLDQYEEVFGSSPLDSYEVLTLYSIRKVVESKAVAKSDAMALKQPIHDLIRYKGDIDDLEREIRDLSSSMTDMGGARDVEEIQDDLKQLNDDARSIKSRIKAQETERESMRKGIITMEHQVGDSRKRLNDLKLKLVEARTLSERIDEHFQSRKAQASMIEAVDQEIKKIAPEISAAEAKMAAVNAKCVEKENQQQREATRLAQNDMNLRSIQQRIRFKTYISDDGLSKLEKCQQQVRRFQDDVEKLVYEVTKVGDEVNGLEKDSSKTDSTQRTIIENLRYRKNRVDLARIEEEIEALESQDAAAQRDRFTKDADVLANKHMRLSSEVRYRLPSTKGLTLTL
jgi:DNA repair protein RAD50